MAKKLSYEYIFNYFKDNGCELLSDEYINSKSNLNYICSCGDKAKITFNMFQKGQRCRKCGVEKSHENARYSFEFVYKTFQENDCVLLSDTYKNNRQKLEYVCSCGNTSIITFSEFIKGTRCAKCGYEKSAEKLNKYTHEEVSKIFSDNKCKLISEYNKTSDNLKYICECGNESATTLHNFINGTRCKECGQKKVALKQSLDYEFVKSEFENEGCVLLSTEYTNHMTHLDYICSCGNRSSITYNNFKKGARCYDCSGKTKWEIDSVREYFKENNCKLLSNEYLNAHQKLKYICECGNESHIEFANFQNGVRCKKCGSKKVSGENNYNWNGGISTLNQYLRTYELTWKKDSMRKCNYKCVLTGKRFEVIHHLYGFNKIVYEVLRILNIDLQIKDSINNLTGEQLIEIKEKFINEIKNYPLGVCLTEEIHRLFHNTYGYGNNTPEQFEEFKTRYKNGEFNSILSPSA